MPKFIIVPDQLSFHGSSIRSGQQTTELARPNVYTSQENGHISVEPPRFTESLLYDPLIAYTSWYASPDSPIYNVSIQSWVIQNCLWTKTEISDWIEAECANVCFAKMQYGDDWMLFFTDLDDMTRFQEWLRIKSSNVFPFIKCPPDTDMLTFTKEVEEWCKDNFKGKFRVKPNHTNPPMVRITCQSQDDLMLVKLRWADLQAK